MKPLQEPNMNIMEIINELFFLSCTYLCLLFTEFTLDIQTKNDLGWIFCIFIATNILLNFTVMISLVIISSFNYCKKRFMIKNLIKKM